MDISAIYRIRQRWETDGSPYCTHDETVTETASGQRTGDIACRKCGETWQRGSETPPPSGTS